MFSTHITHILEKKLDIYLIKDIYSYIYNQHAMFIKKRIHDMYGYMKHTIFALKDEAVYSFFWKLKIVSTDVTLFRYSYYTEYILFNTNPDEYSEPNHTYWVDNNTYPLRESIKDWFINIASSYEMTKNLTDRGLVYYLHNYNIHTNKMVYEWFFHRTAIIIRERILDMYDSSLESIQDLRDKTLYSLFWKLNR